MTATPTSSTMKPRRRDGLLFKGRVWITKDGFHLKRIEGEPAKNPSFWTTRISFVSDFEPVKGVWLHVRTVARVTIRWKGEYNIRSECGPYQLLLAARRADHPVLTRPVIGLTPASTGMDT